MLSLALGLFGVGWFTLPANGQNTPTTQQPSSPDNAREAGRQQILNSERWQRAQRDLNAWLSVQRLYSADEVSMLRAQFQNRIARMSPEELQKQLTYMEEKVAVLSSPEAEEARTWLAQFLAVQAKYTPEQLRQRRPDIARMTASQIRQELAQFQQRRGKTQQGQAAVQQGRALQIQSAQNVQAARRQASEQARQSASRAAGIAADRNRIPAPSTNLPNFSEPPINVAPRYTVGPWGNPIRFDPFW
jgi:hypothetical protein